MRHRIEQVIRERGPIAFSRYMELCLYDPELGYYSRNQEKFGKAGDFYTSSDVHALFGRLLARQFDEMWRALGEPEQIELLELGPGRGLFAQDVLDWSEKRFPGFYRALHYTLAETSPSLRQRLEAKFRERIATRKVNVLLQNTNSRLDDGRKKPTAEGGRRYTDNLSGRVGEGHDCCAGQTLTSMRALGAEVPLIVFANEFFDALPVEILSEKGALRVATRDGRFLEEWVPPWHRLHNRRNL
jgi:SAM-dependent MidA family methyltransferase